MQRRARRQGRKVMREGVLYLLVVNLPSEGVGEGGRGVVGGEGWGEGMVMM